MKSRNTTVILALAFVFVDLTWAQTNSGGAAYQAVGITSAGDIAYPPNTSIAGIVTLDVRVDDSGNEQDMERVRDLPPLTDAAMAAVKKWSFRAGRLNGRAAGGKIRVAVLFNPFNPGGVTIPSEGLEVRSAHAAFEYVPVRVTAANYAIYPVNTVASGTVVLAVLVGEDGNEKQVKLIFGTAPLTTAAEDAVKSWKFASAQYQGKALESQVVLAFVFPAAALARP
jgi:hypothetical protein